MTTNLILGGVRSGKSKLAERLATQYSQTHEQQVIYIATATVNLNADTAADIDASANSMQTRIDQHRQRRPLEWKTIEEPLALGQCISAQATDKHCLIIDCLTLWLTNLLLHPDPKKLGHEIAHLYAALEEAKGRSNIIFVSNETSMGIMPLGELSRRFCDEAGLLHQTLAQHCDRVVLTVAGLPHILKGAPL